MKLKERDYWTKKEVNLIAYKQFEKTLTRWYCQLLMPLPFLRDIRALPFIKNYRDLHSLVDFFRPFYGQNLEIADFKFPLFYGEHGDTEGLPIIRKTRTPEDKSSVLYNLRSFRFNLPCKTVQNTDIEWEHKNNNVIWRGATTGAALREAFVKKYFQHYNIGFSSVKQKPELARFKKPPITIADQLKSKFIVSLEGNDIASNLRWVLSSNSVPIMTKPRWRSWIMEEHLVANIHYLELNDDLSNLEDLLTWASNNDQECKQIALNGRHFVHQFLDDSLDVRIRRNVLQEYASRAKYV
ncbi:glycosyl transferase family 90 [Marinoscillum furvescens]|uniref:glycosyl transferase family 90 n=1 Tax=Marinoscillum furvescens TaxID=1026 RepID=UPI00147680BA|nr:glycosyl transferase family 90 [Marinoscillum furvescens]